MIDKIFFLHEHTPGQALTAADTLSRVPIKQLQMEEEKTLEEDIKL